MIDIIFESVHPHAAITRQYSAPSHQTQDRSQVEKGSANDSNLSKTGAHENNSAASDKKIIRDEIVDFNSQIINEKATHFNLFAKDHTQIIGGALIWEHGDALYIDVH